MSLVDKLWNDLGQLAEKVEHTGAAAVDEVEDALGSVAGDLEGFLDNTLKGLERNPRPVLDAIRRVKPCLVVGGYAVITRYDDVVEALGQHTVFPVPFGPKMKHITDGENFVLGMHDTPRYTYDKSILWLAFRREDAERLVRPIVERAARQAVAGAAGRLDVIADLVRHVPVVVVQHYFGLHIPAGQEAAFAEDSLTISTYLFADLNNDPETERRAEAAAGRINAIIQHSIEAEAGREVSYDQAETVLQRLLALRRAHLPELSDARLRAMILGVLSGFVPTNTMAGGTALEQLLERPEALQGAQEAARAGDHASLHRHWFEALRFNPINPGPFRDCAQAYTVPNGGVGGLTATTIPEGTTVLVSTQAAMFDSARLNAPHQFRLDRPDWHYLHYGHGLHSCLGASMANVQIPATYAAVLRQQGLHRAAGESGQLRYDGPFPAHLTLCWDSAG